MVSEVDDAGGRHALWFPRCLALWRCKALSPAAGRHHDRIVTYEALHLTAAASRLLKVQRLTGRCGKGAGWLNHTLVCQGCVSRGWFARLTQPWHTVSGQVTSECLKQRTSRDCLCV